ncbi:uncharacterized protein B0I36DRAFT_336243 [Microdochium trichocladiopsis]|uniref:Uncharacterized protein n=1 Tax=Microdochium trichocladiopsis TaxID=1682393 RepID=A0A9P8XVD4_9PEZI|nr:uncharacterized protein B0I36DRAFT_336243 [Microdochium trichocladiopsis]KAH7018580.1 hypothetical protein B0I36DRAFT_336243 [Microdochium trichocladiopsis]
MSFITPFLPALKGYAIAGSLINGGTMTSGYRLLPAVYPEIPKSPEDAAKQWSYFYWSMSATVPAIDLTTFLAIGAIAYAEYRESGTFTAASSLSGERPWKIWATAAALMPVGWAWVRRVMNAPSMSSCLSRDPGPTESPSPQPRQPPRTPWR